MKRLALPIGIAVGITIVLGCVAFTTYMLFSHALGGEEKKYSFDDCREEGERAVLMNDVDDHLENLKDIRNDFARREGALERP